MSYRGHFGTRLRCMAKNKTKSRLNGTKITVQWSRDEVYICGREPGSSLLTSLVLNLSSRPSFPSSRRCLKKKKWVVCIEVVLYICMNIDFFFLFNSCTSLNIPTCRAEELTNAPETSSSSELTRHASVKSTSHKTCMQISGNASRDRNESEHILPSSH